MAGTVRDNSADLPSRGTPPAWLESRSDLNRKALVDAVTDRHKILARKD
jgi:hypothetical protein